MRQVSVRQLQQQFHKELKDLPLNITRNGKVFATITPHATISPKEDHKEQGRCEIGTCRGFGEEYKVAFIAEGGEQKKDMYLCDVHLKMARIECESVEEL